MPGPDDLKIQTPGEPLAAATPDTSTGATTQTPAAPTYTAKHNGGGRWKVWLTPAEGDADWFSDFMAAGDGAKAQAEAEALRLTEGGEPLVLDPQHLNEAAAQARPDTSTGAIDVTTLKQPVMTSEGWLCPEPAVKG